MTTLTKIALGSAMFVLIGCNSGPRPDDQVNQFFKVQRLYVDAVAKNLGATNRTFSIEPIFGAQYTLGSLFDQISLSPDSLECIFPSEIVNTNGFAPLPLATTESRFSGTLGIPVQIATLIQFAGLHVGFTNIPNQLQLGYGRLKQIWVADDKLLYTLTNRQSCLSRLSNLKAHPKRILRGNIVGTLSLSSSNFFAGDVSLTVTNSGTLALAYNRSGGFQVEDTEIVPRFAIMTEITEEMVAVRLKELLFGTDGRVPTNFAGWMVVASRITKDIDSNTNNLLASLPNGPKSKPLTEIEVAEFLNSHADELLKTIGETQLEVSRIVLSKPIGGTTALATQTLVVWDPSVPERIKSTKF